MMTIEYARNVLGLAGANSSELDPTTPAPGDRPHGDAARRHRHGRHDAPRRLRRPARRGLAGRRGLRHAPSCPSAIATATSSTRAYRARFDETDFWCSGTSPDGRLVEFIELRSHPFWVGTQAHPELKSRPTRPAPLFRELIGAALVRAEGRSPHLFDLDDRDAALVDHRVTGRAWRLHQAGRDGRASEGFRIRGASARSGAPDGGEFERDVVHHPGAVAVVPAARRRHRHPRPPVPRRPRRASSSSCRRGRATSTARPERAHGRPGARRGGGPARRRAGAPRHLPQLARHLATRPIVALPRHGAHRGAPRSPGRRRSRR